MGRRRDRCINCGEFGNIAAHGLCYCCYRRDERVDDDRLAITVDRHSPALRKEHKKLLRAFAAVMGGLSDLGVQRSEVLKIRQMLEPYLLLIGEYLAPPLQPDQDEGGVNSEQSTEMFTVHSMPKRQQGEPADASGDRSSDEEPC
jgi:hypothetical protein